MIEQDSPFYVISLRGPVPVPGVSVLDFKPWTPVGRSGWAVEDFDVGVITSPFAANELLNQGPEFFQGKIWVAPGAGTAAVLSDVEGVVAPSFHASAEGMLELPELHHVHDVRVAIFTAPGGRDVIGPTLRERGAIVQDIFVYDRVHKDVDPGQIERWRELRPGKFGVLWVTSHNAYREMADQIDEPLAGLTCVVSSERLAALMRVSGHPRVIVAPGPSQEALLVALDQVTVR